MPEARNVCFYPHAQCMNVYRRSPVYHWHANIMWYSSAQCETPGGAGKSREVARHLARWGKAGTLAPPSRQDLALAMKEEAHG